MLEETNNTRTKGIQRPCPNKTLGCTWRSTDDDGITTAEETQELANMNFIACSTNPKGIQEIREHKDKVQRNRQLEQEESQWPQKQPPYPHIDRATINTECSPAKRATAKVATMQKGMKQHKRATETPPQSQSKQRMVEQPEEQPKTAETPEISPPENLLIGAQPHRTNLPPKKCLAQIIFFFSFSSSNQQIFSGETKVPFIFLFLSQ